MVDETWIIPDEWYGIPMEVLGLSEETLQRLKPTGITSVGDCVDFCDLIIDAFAFVTRRWPLPLMEATQEEVKAKLKEHGYWPLDKISDTE